MIDCNYIVPPRMDDVIDGKKDVPSDYVLKLFGGSRNESIPKMSGLLHTDSRTIIGPCMPLRPAGNES